MVTSCRCVSKRYVLVLVLFIGITICYCIRSNVNITILSMVNSTVYGNNTQETSGYCFNISNHEDGNSKQPKKSVGKYFWPSTTQGFILGAFYWGYVLTQILGGILAHRFGPKIIGLASISLCSFLELLIPTAASLGAGFLIAVRICQGLAQGVIFPVVFSLLGRWALPNERSRAVGVVTCGPPIGTIISQTVAGLLSQPRHVSPWTEDSYVSHWTAVHYLFGGLGLAFALVWQLLVHNWPECHPEVGAGGAAVLHLTLEATAEIEKTPAVTLIEIQQAAVQNENSYQLGGAQPTPVPWSRILRASPIWAILVTHVSYNWAWYILVTTLPTYMARFLAFDMSSNGLVSSLPYLMQCLVTPLAAFATDMVIVKQWLSVTWVRKINNAIALVGVSAGFLAVSYSGCNRLAAISLIVATTGLMGFGSSGFSSNSMDLAPKFSGSVVSLTNTVATLPGIFGPMLVGYVTKDSSSLQNWRKVFGTTAGVALLGAISNLLFTSAVLQPWAEG